MKSVRGGEGGTYNCSCGCCYENNGGSNTTDNLIANYDSGFATRCDEIAGVM